MSYLAYTIALRRKSTSTSMETSPTHLVLTFSIRCCCDQGGGREGGEVLGKGEKRRGTEGGEVVGRGEERDGGREGVGLGEERGGRRGRRGGEGWGEGWNKGKKKGGREGRKGGGREETNRQVKQSCLQPPVPCILTTGGDSFHIRINNQ